MLLSPLIMIVLNQIFYDERIPPRRRIFLPVGRTYLPDRYPSISSIELRSSYESDRDSQRHVPMSERFVDSNCVARPTLSGSILLLYDYNKLFRVKIIKGDYEEEG